MTMARLAPMRRTALRHLTTLHVPDIGGAPTYCATSGDAMRSQRQRLGRQLLELGR